MFICSKTSGDQVPKGVYANLKMNQFFGRDVLSVDGKDTMSKPQGPMKVPIRKSNPTMKRIFQK